MHFRTGNLLIGPQLYSHILYRDRRNSNLHNTTFLNRKSIRYYPRRCLRYMLTKLFNLQTMTRCTSNPQNI